MITNDGSLPTVDSGCQSTDSIADAMPLVAGAFGSMTGFYNVVFDASGGLGLVIAAQNVGYLALVSDALLNDDGSDDAS